jgi:hypothetical protein
MGYDVVDGAKQMTTCVPRTDREGTINRNNWEAKRSKLAKASTDRTPVGLYGKSLPAEFLELKTLPTEILVLLLSALVPSKD